MGAENDDEDGQGADRDLEDDEDREDGHVDVADVDEGEEDDEGGGGRGHDEETRRPTDRRRLPLTNAEKGGSTLGSAAGLTPPTSPRGFRRLTGPPTA